MDADDRPLTCGDPFHQELRLLLAPRADPASGPGPRENPPTDPGAVRRAELFLRRLVA